MSDFSSSIFDLPSKMLSTDLGSGLASAMKGAQDLANVTLDKASGTFNNLAKDTLALVDKESISAKTTLTSFIDQQRGLLSEAMTRLKNGSVNLNTIAQAVDFKDGLTVDKDQLLSRVSAAVGFPVSSVDGFKESIQESLLQQMNSASNGLVGSVLTTNGSKITLNGRWRENATNGVLGFLGRLGDDGDALTTVVDNPATTSFFNAMMQQTIKVGLSSGISTLADKYYQAKDAKAAIANYSSYAVVQADIPTITAIIDQIGPTALIAKNPDTVASILKNYTFKADTTAAQYPALIEELTAALALIDQNWWQQMFMGQLMVNYSVFQGISADALTLLKSDTRFASACVFAPLFRTELQISLVKSQYPLLAIAADQTT